MAVFLLVLAQIQLILGVATPSRMHITYLAMIYIIALAILWEVHEIRKGK